MRRLSLCLGPLRVSSGFAPSWKMIQKLESSRWREGSRKNSLTHGTWSFTAVMSQYGLFSVLAAGTSTVRSNVGSSLGSTKWSSRISCMSGSGSLAGTNKTKPICKVTRVPSPSAPTCRGGRRMRLLGLRDRWRPRGASASSPHCLGKSYDTHQLGGCRASLRRSGTVLGARAAAESSRPVCFWFCGRRTCSSNSRKRKKARARKGRQDACNQAGSGQLSRIVNVWPGLWASLAPVWDSLLANLPLSELVGMRSL